MTSAWGVREVESRAEPSVTWNSNDSFQVKVKERAGAETLEVEMSLDT